MQGTATLARNKHLYNVLGLADFSSIDEIRTAYKALALRYHPDKTLGDPVLTEKYKEIKLVYELLSNEEQKKQYDTSLRLFQAYTHVRVNGERGPLTGRTRSSYATYRGNAYSNNNASMATGATPRSARTTKEDATRRAAYANGHAESTTTTTTATATATATTGGSFGSPSHNNNTTASNGSNGATHPMSYEELYRQRYPFAFASTPTTNHTTAAGSSSNKTEAYAHQNNNNNTSANMSAGQASSARGAAEYVNHAAGTATNATPYTPNNNTTTASSNATTTAAGASTPLGSHYTAEQQELFRRREKERRAELKRQLEKERELRREEERAAARRAQEKRQELLQRRWFEQQQAFSAAQRGSRSRTASNTSHTSHRRRFNSLHTSSKPGAAGSAAANSSSPLFPSSPLFTQNSSYNSNNNNAAPSVPGSNYTTAASNAAAFTGLMRGATTTTTNNSSSGPSMNLPAKEAAIRVPELNLGNLARELHRMNIHAARTARVGPTTTATSRTATKAAAAAGVHGTEKIRRTASEASAIAPLPAEPMTTMTMMRPTAPFHTTLRRTASSVVFSATNTSTTSCSPTAMTPTMGWQAGVQERNAHTAVGGNAQAVYSTYHYYTNESSSNNSNNTTTTTTTTASTRNTAAAAAKEGSGPERVRRMQTARVRTTPAREFVLPQTAVSASTTKEKDKEEDEEEREIAKSREGEDQLARHVQPSTSPTSHETAQTSSQNGAVYSPANSTSAAAMHATNETFIVKVQGGANAEEGPRSTTANTPSALPRRMARSATSATRPSVVINAAALVNTNRTSQADSQADKKKNNNSSNSSSKEEQDTSYHSNTNHTSSATTPGTRRRTRSQVSRAKSRKATSRERTHSYTASAVPEETPARLLILLQEDEQIERGQLIGAEEAQAWARLQRSLQQYTEQSLLQRLVPQENKARASIAYEAYQGREYLSLLGAELRERAAVMRNEAQQRRQMAGSAAHDYYFALQRADGASRFAFAERYRMARMPQPSPTRRTNTSSDSGGAKKGVVVMVHTVDSEPFACDDQPTHKTSVAAADVTRALHNANKSTIATPRTTNTNITAPHTEAKTSAVGRETSVLSGPALSQLAAREASARLALAQVEDADMTALLHWQANARHRRYSAEKAAAVRLVVLRHQQQMHELQEQVRALQDRLARYEQAEKVRSSETSAFAKNNNTTMITSVTGVTRTTMTTVTNTSTNAVRQNTPAATSSEQQSQTQQPQQPQRGPMSPVTPRRAAVKVRNHNNTTATTAAGGGKGKETVNSSSDSSLVFSIHSA